MIIKHICLFLLGFSTWVHAQDRPLWKATASLRSPAARNIRHLVFEEVLPASGRMYPEPIKCLRLQEAAVSSLVRQPHPYLIVDLPIQGKTLHLHLVQTRSFEPDTKILSGHDSALSWKPGLYYHGVVEGDPHSLVAFSFFENGISGVFSSADMGDWSIGTRLGTHDLCLYPKSLKESSVHILCPDAKDAGTPDVNPSSTHNTQTTTHKVVRIYYELDPNVYNGNGQNMTATLNWLSALHHGLKTLYFNEGIRLKWNATRVWQSALPYLPEFYHFMSARPTFEGDLAAFVAYEGANGVANGVGSLCRSQSDGNQGSGPHCLSFIPQHFDSLPANSFTLKITAHEIGHLLGSHHTHSCVWNGNNTQIDDCGNANLAPFDQLPGACYDSLNPIVPTNGGTIMSYCQVNLANGFGSQPAERMRQRINGFTCIADSAQTGCFPTLDSLRVIKSKSTSARLVLFDSDTSHRKWLVRMGGQNPPHPWDTVRSPEFTINGLGAGTSYLIEVKNICPQPLSADFISFTSLTTKANYCGTLFDDGDDNVPGYQPGAKDYILYPEAIDQKVKISFQYCVLYPKDTLYIYNGDSPTGPPLAYKIGAEGPNPNAVSTDPEGAMTVSIRSGNDISSIANGWMAFITCAVPVGVQQESIMEGNWVYPNPVEETLWVKTTAKPRCSFELYNAMGVRIQTVEGSNRADGGPLTAVSVQGLPRGTYWLKVGEWERPLRFVKQ